MAKPVEAAADPAVKTTEAAPTAASLWQLVRKSVTAWSDDYAPSMGAALAYYTMFSLAPLLLLVISIAGVVFGAEAARGQIVGQLGGLIGQEGATAIQGLLKSASEPAKSTFASIISIVTLIVGATIDFWRAAERPRSHLARARDGEADRDLGHAAHPAAVVRVDRVDRVSCCWCRWWSAPAWRRWAAGGAAWFGDWVIALQIVNQIVSLLFVTALFALMYRILPSVHVAWQDVWRGAVATGVLFTIGKFAISMYLGKAGVQSGFGAAGSIIVLLVWVYYSSQIFLLGAEFTWLYAHNHGSRAHQPAPRPASDVAKREPSPLPALPPAKQPAGLLPEYPTPAGDFATAAAVWVGFGLVRSVLARFQKNKNPA